jgi:hypothetical protein
MSFFNYTPASADGPARWSVSRRIWIYFAISIPLTFITTIFWIKFNPSQSTLDKKKVEQGTEKPANSTMQKLKSLMRKLEKNTDTNGALENQKFDIDRK